MRGLPAAKMTCAAAVLLGLSAGSAAAATGGAGLAQPEPKRAATAPTVVTAPVLSPVASIPQLAAGVTFRKVSKRAVSAATLTYVSHARAAVQVRVDVVRLADGLSVFTDERTVAPEATQKVSWSGRARSGLALDGRYQLRVGLAGDAGASSSTAGAVPGGGASPEAAAPPPGSTSVKTFTFVGAAFPVRGPHDYGQGGAAFGAGRTGHMHQGQDVMARCGTPLVAARGGTVVMSTYQALAGNYLVIADPITGESNMYAHLREPATLKRGQRVETGQPIGVVGDTGDASACHLHFEIWTSPGWYQGGEPIDPLPTLKRWDRFS
ncbi:MAG TPA: M23 family metallopeptidase [Conexibacter sp.]|nr:M23 family metallopeptidase [Conexibacter sp.]